MNRTLPKRYCVFEQEPQFNSLPNKIIFGPCDSEEEAMIAIRQYFGGSRNYYVDIYKKEIT